MNYTRVFALITAVAIVCSVGTFSSVADEKTEDYMVVTTMMVDFSDVESFKDCSELDDEIYGADEESAHAFWNLASSGAQGIVPNEDFHPDEWYRAPRNLSHYAKDTEERFDVNAHELIAWLVERAISDGLEIDFENSEQFERYPSYYRLNDIVFCFVVAGDAEGYTNYPRDDAFWPHKSMAVVASEDGKNYMAEYILVTEDMSYYGGGAMVIAHELGHVYGLADLYDYHCGGPYVDKGECTYPFTYYDIMVGRHGGRGLTGLHREMLGWITPKVVSGVGTYELTIPPITTNSPDAYVKIPIADTKEIIALEYRTKTGIDAFWGGIPSEGLIVYKINEGTSYRNNTDWDNDGQQYCKLFNPRETEWHDNPCYTSDDLSYVGPDTKPSTKSEYAESTEAIKVTVLSEDENGAKIKVEIEHLDKIWVNIPESIMAGHLHDTFVNLEVVNFADKDVVLRSDFLVDEITLEPFEERMVRFRFRFPDGNLSLDELELDFVIETENNVYSDKVLLKNILEILDYDRDGEVSVPEVKVIFDMIGSDNVDLDYDFDGNGSVEFEDLLIAAKYVGLRY